jgi:carboxymethylenebutenolidase
MYEDQATVAQLVHLYIDGAFSRRELVERLTRACGSVAAGMAALAAFPDAANAQPTPCPVDVRVAENDPAIRARDVNFPGEAGTMFGYLAMPAGATEYSLPGVIVIHENRGLVEHIRDVTRRFAKAGFAALGVDLLSRQGGTSQFTEPTQQTQAYGRTTVDQRRADLISGLSWLKAVPEVRHDRIGVTGYCAGGQNSWDLAVHLDELGAVVPFYGAPPAVEDLQRIRAPIMAIYAETDRNLTTRMAPVLTEMLARQRSFGFIVYPGVGHAFHNDTGANYNATAACDAFARTVSFFNQHLRRT